MGAYLDNRKQKDSDSSNSFFKKVDFMLPRRKKSSLVNEVPELSGSIEPTIYAEDKPSFFSKVLALFSSSNESSKEIEDEIDHLPEDVKPEIREIEDEIEEVDDQVHELEEKREGLVRRFFNLFRSNRSYSDDEDVDFEHSEDVELDPNEVLKAETRQTLKIIHKWVSRLPPDQINAFKRSPDFQRYKDLLDKYGLLK